MTKLHKGDDAFRDFALHANLWRVLWKVCLPLSLYAVLNFVFKILDTMMASHISAASVSTVAYLSQISTMLSALGAGLAVGAGVQISKAYGAGDYDMVKTRVSTLFCFCGGLGLLLLLILEPLAVPFLQLTGTPSDLMDLAVTYFRIELGSIVVQFFNNIYIAVERCRGNTRRIFLLNLAVVLVKLSLTAFFVYILDGTINHIAVATLLSNCVILVTGLIQLFRKGSAFSVSFRKVSVRRPVLGAILNTSYPVVAEKIFFSLGKVVVNAMSAIYGSLTVGAISISGSINGLTVGLQNGCQEGASSIISQNLGAHQIPRAVETYRKILFVNILIGAIFSTLTLIFLDPIIMLFADADESFADLIAMVYRYEVMTAVFLGINSASMAFLYGAGYTKLAFFINFARLFLFRIPLLWCLQNFTSLGSESVGIVLLVSNILVAICAITAAVLVARRLMLREGLTFWGRPR